MAKKDSKNDVRVATTDPEKRVTDTGVSPQGPEPTEVEQQFLAGSEEKPVWDVSTQGQPPSGAEELYQVVDPGSREQEQLSEFADRE